MWPQNNTKQNKKGTQSLSIPSSCPLLAPTLGCPRKDILGPWHLPCQPVSVVTGSAGQEVVSKANPSEASREPFSGRPLALSPCLWPLFLLLSCDLQPWLLLEARHTPQCPAQRPRAGTASPQTRQRSSLPLFDCLPRGRSVSRTLSKGTSAVSHKTSKGPRRARGHCLYLPQTLGL